MLFPTVPADPAMNTATPRPPLPDQDESGPNSRDLIIEAAKRVIEERGITGATMRAIALEAGLTTGAIVHHFKDKGELLLQTLQSFFDPWFDTLAAARALPTAWQQLEHIFLSTLPGPDHPRSRTQIWLAMLLQLEREERLWKTYSANYHAIREEVYAIFRRAQAEGPINSALDAEIECNRLFALSDGLVVSALGEPDRFPQAALRHMMELQLSALLLDGPGAKR
jgi:AcrR family transcriptional regulator